MLVFSTPSPPWLLLAIYGPCSYSSKRVFWDSLSSEADRFLGAWLLIGDYNGIYSGNDHSSNHGINRGLRLMIEVVDNLGMISIPSSGFYFTWSNRRNGRNRVYSHLDRGMVNEEWWGFFPNASIELLPQTSSDHNPQVLSCFEQQSSVKRPFRFEAA
ncbi:hypothetical protein UlMin_020944 [Ulmus minor]